MKAPRILAARIRRRLGLATRVARSRRQVRRELPGLSLVRGPRNATERRLAEEHRRYITDVSSPRSAVSLETSLFLHRLVRLVGARHIADLGSGFSSYLLRDAIADADGVTGVHSVENDPFWLAQTREYLAAKNCTGGPLTDVDTFLSDAHARGFDLVFLDLGGREQRIAMIAESLARLRPGGLLIADDHHKVWLREALAASLSPHDTRIDLFAVTRDAFGRYACAVRRAGGP